MLNNLIPLKSEKSSFDEHDESYDLETSEQLFISKVKIMILKTNGRLPSFPTACNQGQSKKNTWLG